MWTINIGFTEMITCSRARDIDILRSPDIGSGTAPLPQLGPAYC